MSFLTDLEEKKKKKQQDFVAKPANTSSSFLTTLETKRKALQPSTTTATPSQTAAQEQKQPLGQRVSGMFNSIGDKIKSLFNKPGEKKIETPQVDVTKLSQKLPASVPANGLTVTEEQPASATLKPPQNIIDTANNKDNLDQFGLPKSYISAAPPKTETIFSKIGATIDKLFGITPEQRQEMNTGDEVARAQNAYAILKLHPELNKVTSLNKLAAPGGSPFKNSDMEEVTKELGIRTELTNSEFVNLMFALSLPVSFAAGAEGLALVGTKAIPLTTQLMELGKFTAVSTAFDLAFNKLTGKQTLSDLAPDSPQYVQFSLDALELIGKGYISHGLNKNLAVDVKDALTKTTLEKYNIPKTVTLSSEAIRDIHQTGGLTTEAEKQWVVDLKKEGKLSDADYLAILKGKKDLTVEIPATKVVSLVDRDYWIKVKSFFGVSPNEPKVVTTEYSAGKTPDVGTKISGLLPAGQPEGVPINFTAEALIDHVNSTDLAGTPMGEEMLKLAAQAQKDNQMVQIFPVKEGSQNMFKSPSPSGNFFGFSLMPKVGLIDESGKAVPPPDTSYRGQHQAPAPEENATLSDLNKNGIFPADVYSNDAPRLYSSGFKYDKQAFDIVNKVKGKPDTEVTVFRAVPKDAPDTLLPGDWVAITKEYAQQHGESNLGGDFKIISEKVKAGDITTDGNSIQEWGYNPTKALEPIDFTKIEEYDGTAQPIEITHGSPQTSEELKINGVHGSRSAIERLGNASFWSDTTEMSGDFGGGGSVKISTAGLKFRSFPTLEGELAFVKAQGAPDLAEAIRKEGIYDGFIIPNNDPKIGNTFGITSIDKINETITGKKRPVEAKLPGSDIAPPKETAVVEPSTKELSNNLDLIKEALTSGDVEAARAIYMSLDEKVQAKLPEFAAIKKSVEVKAKKFKPEIINQYGEYQKIVNKMRNFVHFAGENKDKTTGELFREHIPQRVFGQASDEVADALGMSENDFIQMLQGDAPKTIEETQAPTVPEAVAPPEASVVLQSVVIPGIDKFFEQDVIPTVSNVKEGSVKTFDSIRKIFAPTTRGPEAQLSASILRENLGKMVRNKEIVFRQLEDARKKFDRYSKKQALDFMDHLEAGDPIPGAEEFTKVFREALSSRWQRIQEIKGGDAYIENYFPHIWKNPTQAKATLAKFFGKRPFEGTKGYMKQRKIPTIKEGIGMGLELTSYNPVDLISARIADMERFLMAHDVMEAYKANKLRKFVSVGGKAPEGWRKVDDATSTVFYRPSIKEYFDEKVMGTLEQVATDFGIKHERVQSLGGQMMGVSFTGQSKVKTRFATPEAVLLHEIGHQLDPVFDIQTKFAFSKDTGEFRTTRTGKQVELKESIAYRQQMKQELRDLVDTKWEDKEVSNYFKNYVRKGEEKVAAMFEAYLQAPKKFKEVAPHIYREFVDLLKSDPKLKPVLDIEPSMTFTSREQQLNILAKGGDWYMPEQAATVLNNYLSPGIHGNPLYDAFRMTGNAMNQVQLGISAFHATFTSIDAVISRGALGVQQLFEGKTRLGIKHIILSPTAWVTNVFKGNALLKDYYRQNPELPDMIWALEKAGGRVKMDSFYHNDAVTNFMKALRSGNLPGAAIRTPGALIEAFSRPLLQEFVPRQKLGVFSDLATDILDSAKKGNWDERKTILRLQEAWDSVDNRMGQLVYDNLFWNKTLKDISLISVRSVGWNLGTFREGQGLYQYAELPFKVVSKAGRASIRMTPKMAYVLVYPIYIAILGAIIAYLYTGKGPKELKDYYYPKTGKIKPDGTEERVSLPSYMKDVFAYSIEPGQTLKNKLHPAVSAVLDMLDNADYYGTEIRNPNDPLVTQIGSEFDYIFKQFRPFSFTAIEQNRQSGEGAGAQAASFFGLAPAPAYVTKTPMQKEISDIYNLRNQGVKSKEAADVSQAKTKIRALYLKGDVAEANKQMKALNLTDQQIQNLVDSADIPVDVRLFGMLSEYDQEDLVAKMSLAELNRYGWGVTKDLKSKLSTINSTTKNFVDLVRTGQVKQPKWKRNVNINQ